jgi:membrane-associated phospholipid phosphatase
MTRAGWWGSVGRGVRAWVMALALAQGGAGALGAQAAVDSSGKHVFSRTDAYVLGGFAAALVAARPLDTYLTRKLQQPQLQYSPVLGHGATVVRVLAVPGSLIGGGAFYLLGRARHDPGMSDAMLHSLEAVVLTGAVTSGIKLVAGRARPYVDTNNPHNFMLFRGFKSDAYQSFPSGHSSTAFAMAAALTAEAGEWHPHQQWIVGGVTYTLATLTGASRMYNNMHWASDVVGGAALGTITGLAVVRYNHIHSDNSLNRHLIPKGHRAPAIPIVFSIPVN